MTELIGIGNAICDILVKVEDIFFDKIKYQKGSMSLISYQEADDLMNLIKNAGYNYSISSGGSIANTVALLSEFNIKTALIGNVSDDYFGSKFINDIEKSGVKFVNLHDAQDKNSAKCIVLVSEDGERTLCTYLGCSSYLNLNQNQPSLKKLENAKFVYIEGYIFDNPDTTDEILTFIDNNPQFHYILSLSDKGCIERNQDVIGKIIKDSAGTIIGNESEFAKLLDLESINANNVENALNLFKANQNLQNVIITLNKNGAYHIDGVKISQITTEQVKAYDSTGAGDAFAAGFLYGTVNKIDPIKSCKIGNLLAKIVIQQLGARPNIQVPVISEEIAKIA
jgi:sugar/nucleoside kinase (ribokinase family)